MNEDSVHDAEKLEFDFERSLGYWIFATAHQLSLAMNEELHEHGITYRQWEVLAWLCYQGELSQSDLAGRMGIEAPTLVGVLDRMERDGWIRRVPSETDRRKKMICVTERVGPAWARMVDCGLRVRERATEGLSEQELLQLRSTLEKIQTNLMADATAATPKNPSESSIT